MLSTGYHIIIVPTRLDLANRPAELLTSDYKLRVWRLPLH
jgi:hypothetical protein